MYYIDNVIDLDKSLLWDFFIVLSLTQYQILMQHMRIYSAWLPSVTFPNYGNVVEREKTVVNRLRRATNHGKFSRAAWKGFEPDRAIAPIPHCN